MRQAPGGGAGGRTILAHPRGAPGWEPRGGQEVVALPAHRAAESPGGAAGALYAKLGWVNPFGSGKERAASYLLMDLARRGEITQGRGVVEPTSGNTGISMAGIAAALGVRMRAVIPNRVPLEKKVLLKIAGADIDVVNDAVCPSPGMGEGSINLARTR